MKFTGGNRIDTLRVLKVVCRGSWDVNATAAYHQL